MERKNKKAMVQEGASGNDSGIAAGGESGRQKSALKNSKSGIMGVLFRIGVKLNKFKFFSILFAWIKRLAQDRVNLVSAQLAYFLVLSFFPFTIFLLSVLSYSRFGQADILFQHLTLLPSASADFLQNIIMDIVNSKSTALLSSSFVLTLWSSSTGMKNLLNSMTKTFNKGEDRRPIWWSRLVALAATVLLVALITLMLVSQVFSGLIYSYLSDYFSWGDLAETIWNYMLILVPLIVLSLGLAMLYRYGPYFPKDKRLKFSKAWVGGVVASVSWILFSYLFSIYVTNFSNYAVVYGSLGAIIVLLLWLYFSAFCIMAGSVFASVLQDRSQGEQSVTISAGLEDP